LTPLWKNFPTQQVSPSGPVPYYLLEVCKWQWAPVLLLEIPSIKPLLHNKSCTGVKKKKKIPREFSFFLEALKENPPSFIFLLLEAAFFFLPLRHPSSAPSGSVLFFLPFLCLSSFFLFHCKDLVLLGKCRTNSSRSAD
jgi:hypothetical protein